jgi:hypothetical protein
LWRGVAEGPPERFHRRSRGLAVAAPGFDDDCAGFAAEEFYLVFPGLYAEDDRRECYGVGEALSEGVGETSRAGLAMGRSCVRLVLLSGGSYGTECLIFFQYEPLRLEVPPFVGCVAPGPGLSAGPGAPPRATQGGAHGN